MESFLHQVAGRLYREYGDEISSLYILFPSRRAQLFFTDALSEITNKPIWQPHYQSIDDVMGEQTDLSSGDHVRLMTELYKVYSQFHDESFDLFYFWGEMLLADFDLIDKYMVDARMLFANINDLREMEADQSYLTPEQKEIISGFWKSFGPGSSHSDEKERFISIWSTLFDIYTAFRDNLQKSSIAYPGMVYRDVAEKIQGGAIPSPEKPRRYAIVGFNALSQCEKILFKHLAKEHSVDFFWDYDHYYTDQQKQEAGLFLRENIALFPPKPGMPYSYDSFSQQKNIVVVSSPSDSLQCKYAAEFLAETTPYSDTDPRENAHKKTEPDNRDKKTAIVLTDENLLIPLLHSIPDKWQHINVTMGYPLRNTPAYSLLERLIELRNRKRIGRDGSLSFYHSDVTGLLTHPYIAATQLNAQEMLVEIMNTQSIYIPQPKTDEGTLQTIFCGCAPGWQGLAQYLREVLSGIVSGMVAGDDIDKQSLEYLTIITDNITKLSNSLEGAEVEITEKVFASLLRKMLQNIRIPFEGEPLEGIQVMGILETRNLDFENVLILSANDDTFPGNRAVSSSFIPNNLRIAYGLPTPRHHEGVYAYYFYRLLQRAKNIHIAYSSKADAKSSGEQSRYIYQLRYESPHRLQERTIGMNVGVDQSGPISIVKDAAITTQLAKYTDGTRQLSPTSFYNFIACPLKFYFHSIARLDPADEITEEIDSPMFGSILHNAMMRLYEPLKGITDPRHAIGKLIGTEKVDKAIDEAINQEFFRGRKTEREDYNGNTIMIGDIVKAYINKCILPFDAARNECFVIMTLEEKIAASIELPDGKRVALGGTLDRTDSLEDGTMRVVDYKTGREQLGFQGIASLFSGIPTQLNSAVLQTLLYSMMLSSNCKRDVRPELYFVRNMNAIGYSPLTLDKEVKAPVMSYFHVKENFEQYLIETLGRLFDVQTPFSQCEDPKVCQWCDFNKICRR